MIKAKIEWQKCKQEFLLLDKQYKALGFFQKLLRSKEFNFKFQKNLTMAKYWENKGGR